MKRAYIHPVKKPFDLICDDIAADKSISHRAAMFSLLSDSPSSIENFLTGEDTLATLSIVEQLGAVVRRNGGDVYIEPPEKLKEPNDVLDCGNAGTGMRLFCGLLSSVEGSFVLTGDKYLRERPMKRVADPLRSVGAKIDGREWGNKAPLHIRGAELKAFRYSSPIDSAQVKSAMILAALHADGTSYYHENFLSRDHTERMLRGMGASLGSREENGENWIVIEPLSSPLKPLNMRIPADPSSAFFFAVAAVITPGSAVKLENVSLNPTRIEAFKVLEKMGADIVFEIKEEIYEPIGTITVRYSKDLHGINVSERIAWLIDELPALSIAMATASGESRVSNAKELRVKESDRISTVVEGLRACGIDVEEFDDGYRISGGKVFHPAKIDSHGDHRIAMSFAIAGLICGMEIEDTECIDTSFPNFFKILENMTKVDI